jgi:hypothetical protein
MIIRCAVCCAFLLAFTTHAWSAANAVTEKTSKTARKSTHKPPSNSVAKAGRKLLLKIVVRTAQSPGARAQKTVHKTSWTRNVAPAHAPHAPQGTEILTCRNGTEDRHARIGVVLVGGKADSFAYYSKWKPRTCSIHLQRDRDSYSRWTDKGNVTNVSFEHGLFLIEHGKGEYRFVFRDIDRNRFCGMDGTINGTLILRKGSERCELTGIMEEGVPLGQANAQREQPAAATAIPESPRQPAPVRQAAQPFRSSPQSVFPSSASE